MEVDRRGAPDRANEANVLGANCVGDQSPSFSESIVEAHDDSVSPGLSWSV
jgi:hypothetical protein